MSRKAGSRGLSAWVVAIGLTIAGGTASPATAQAVGDPDAGRTTWLAAPCQQCHGWAADGVGTINQMEGPSLRGTFLTPELMAEVIRCGRPGTVMPSFRTNSWTTIVPCYGMTAPMEGRLQPVPGETTYSDRAINNIVAFLFRDIVGKGPVTQEFCVEMLGPDSARCPAYPRAADLPPAPAP